MRSRGLSLMIVPAAVLICLVLCPGTRSAQESDPFSDPRFDVIIDSYNLKDAYVADVLRLIAEQNDLNVVLSPSVTGTINLRLSDVTLREVLYVILEAANLTVDKTDNIIHVYSDSEFEDRVRAGKMITEIFQIDYIEADKIFDILHDYLSEDGSMKMFERQNKTSRTSSNNRNNNSNNYRSRRGDSKDMIIVTDYPANVAEIRSMIDMLDSETRQVMIEARIVETTLTDSDILGTDWQIGASLTGSPAEFDTRYGGKISYGSLSMSGFSAVYERLLEDKNTNILSNAKITVMDNEQAHIHVGETIPVGISTIGAGAGGSTSFGTTGVQQWETGVTLDVTPTVLEQGIVRMYIQPEISTVQGFSSIGSSSAPITSTRGVQTQILIKSGETIVIGGLVQDQESKTNKKVPLLGDLPVVGSAFRKKTTSSTKVNLLIFITGTVMELKSDLQQDVLMSPSVREALSMEPEETIETPVEEIPAEEMLETPTEETEEPEEAGTDEAVTEEEAAPAEEELEEAEEVEEVEQTPELEKYLEYK